MPALIPLALTLVPGIAQWLFGDKAGQTAAQVAAVAESITGTADPHAQVAALADPDKASAFALELHKLAAAMQAEQHAADLAAMQAQFADVASARSQTLTLMQARSTIAWGAPLVSGVVLVIFCLMLALVLLHGLPANAESLANVMLGALAGMTTAVVNYWVGSSAGSYAKDGVIAEQSRSLATSTPGPGAPAP